MFIYSIKAKTIKMFGLICVALVGVIMLAAFVPNSIATAAAANSDIDYSGIKDNEDRIRFLGQFGWKVSSEATESEQVTIPSEFDKIFAGYNEIQKRQGLDLSKYKGKTMMRYTYEVSNYPDYDGRVQANILVYRGKVVGGDICSADINGFVHGFENQKLGPATEE